MLCLRRLYFITIISALLVAFILMWKMKLPCLPFCLSTRESIRADIDDFHHQWCRMQRWRVDWGQAVRPCKDKMAWNQREPTSHDRTSAHRSYMSRWHLRPAGNSDNYSSTQVNDCRNHKNYNFLWLVHKPLYFILIYLKTCNRTVCNRTV